jgi:protein involved in polysaccharide export with SLBB domain
MILQEAARKGELTPEARQIVQSNPDLKKYLPAQLREALEAEERPGEGKDNTALRQVPKETQDELAAREQRMKESMQLPAPYDWKKSVYVSRLFLPRLKNEEKEQLIHFGHDLFDPREDSPDAVSAEGVPVPDDYVLGPGDEIVVRLWGRLEGTHRMKVDRDGKIFFPKLGPMSVAGKTFGEMKAFLRGKVGTIAEVRADISLGQVKGFHVSVLGEVKTQGQYQVSSFHTAFQAIAKAGGIKDIGSLRRVQVKRGKETIQEVDIYDFLLKGDVSGDIRLRAGDAIFVPVAGPFVAVVGDVRRQAIYELKTERTIGEVLAMAGGLAPSAYKRRAQVERLEENRARVVFDLNLEEERGGMGSWVLGDGDLLRVLSVLPDDENAIVVEGNVQRPGKYEWKPGLTVGALIADEKFFLPETFLDYALITRFVGPEKTREVIPVNLRRVVIEKDSAADVPMKPLDTLMVYKRSSFREEATATVGGEVRAPGVYRIFPGMRVSDLVKLAGDVTRSVSLDEAELTRYDDQRNATLRAIDLGKALARDPDHDIPIRDQDHLLVRPVSDLQEVRYVTVSGELLSPGIYAARKGERLGSILRRAGGFKQGAFLKGAVYTRVSVQKRQQELIDRTVLQLEQEVARTSAKEAGAALDREDVEAQKQVFEARKELLSRLRLARAQGRIIIRLDAPEKLAGTENDLLVEAGDTLEVPPTPEVVNVMGRVYNPTAVVFTSSSNTVGYYLGKVGGPTEDADRDHIFVVRADGSVMTKEHADERMWISGGNRLLTSKVDAGDAIVVPEKLVFTRVMKDVKDITQILYQIAVTAGVLIVAF